MKLTLIRHAEPDFQILREKGFSGHALNLAPLTPLGEKQALELTETLKDTKATLILSSPYTRALQTATILSKHLNLDVIVEVDLHEWLVDRIFSYVIHPQEAYVEFVEHQGKKMKHHQGNWETFDEISMRVKGVLDRYQSYDHIIVVCHAFVIASLTSFDQKVPHAGQITIEYDHKQ